jgi:hypothetical protein
MGHGPGSARSVETPLLVLKALDLARALGVSHAARTRHLRYCSIFLSRGSRLGRAIVSPALNSIGEYKDFAHDQPVIRRPGTQPPAEYVPGLTSDPRWSRVILARTNDANHATV